VKQWLNVKDDVEGKEGNKRYTLSKVLFFGLMAARLPLQQELRHLHVMLAPRA